MSEPPDTGAPSDAVTERVRVTGPPRRAAPHRRVDDIDAETALGSIYLGSLLRVQLRLALRAIVLLGLTLGALPLAFQLAPGLADVSMLGVPLAWLLLGGLVYPWLLFLGWRYVRRAEANERDFADLMSEVER